MCYVILANFGRFQKEETVHIYHLHKEIVIKPSIVCLRNETNVKQTTDTPSGECICSNCRIG